MLTLIVVLAGCTFVLVPVTLVVGALCVSHAAALFRPDAEPRATSPSRAPEREPLSLPSHPAPEAA